MTESKVIIREDETLDDLILGDMNLIQSVHGYRFSLDAVLLAHFCKVTGVNRAVDLGTGSGVIPLILAARDPSIKISGIEIQPAMAERAQRSISLNQLGDRIEIIHSDLREIDKHLPGECAELVLSNPPFWKIGEGHVSLNPEQAIARHELECTLEDIIQQGSYLLNQGGKMVIIHRAQRLDEIMVIFRKYKLYLKRLRLVHSFRDRDAGLLLIEGQKNRPGNLSILPPLIVYDKPGHYSQEIQCLYNH